MTSSRTKLSKEKKSLYAAKSNERKKKKYKEDPVYREKLRLKAKKKYKNNKKFRDRMRHTSKIWYAKLSEKEKKKYQRSATEYKKKLQKKFDETKDVSIFFRHKIRKIKGELKKRNLIITISVDDLVKKYEIQNGRCYYSGDKLILKIDHTDKFNRENMDIYKNVLTLDRLNPKEGYTKNNIVLSTLKCNLAKASLSYDEFVKVCENIKEKLSAISE